jgi:hypothetical protein
MVSLAGNLIIMVQFMQLFGLLWNFIINNFRSKLAHTGAQPK